MAGPKPKTYLIINPNSSESMTDGISKIVDGLGHQSINTVFMTAPSQAPASINNAEDALKSASAILPHLMSLEKYDGFLVCCYSVHPLVPMLRERVDPYYDDGIPKHVVGIFEASVSTALGLLSHPIGSRHSEVHQKFGIVSTEEYWEKALTDGVMEYIGFDNPKHCGSFKGVETTGLSASELHTMPKDEVRKRMKEATKRLVRDGDVGVVCLGCAGMASMDEMVLEACIEELGPSKGRRIHIVDGIKSGIGMLDNLARAC